MIPTTPTIENEIKVYSKWQHRFVTSGHHLVHCSALLCLTRAFRDYIGRWPLDKIPFQTLSTDHRLDVHIPLFKKAINAVPWTTNLVCFPSQSLNCRQTYNCFHQSPLMIRICMICIMWQIGNHQNRVDKNDMVEGSLAGNALITKAWPSLERIWVVQKQIGK